MSLFESSFLEKDVFDQTYAEMIRLAQLEFFVR